EVLAADHFRESHCFGVVSHGDSAWSGLTFDPRHDTNVHSVKGVLWLDSISGAPKRLEYQYTRIDSFLRSWIQPEVVRRVRAARSYLTVNVGPITYSSAADFGGLVAYDELGKGCFIPRTWEVRRPWGNPVGMFRPGTFDMTIS